VTLPDVMIKPCPECPWRRIAAKGWLGPYTAEEWNTLALSDTAIACHLTIEEDDNWDSHNVRQCAGVAIFRSNIGKLPRDPQVLTLPADRDTVFGYGEFVDHHTRKE
jgi:hypothetical protein